MAQGAITQEDRQNIDAGRRPRGRLRALINRQELPALALLLLTFTILALQSENFLSTLNLLNVARGVAWFAVAGFGASMVILIGGIDFSVSAVMALAGMLCALALRAGSPIPVAVAVGLISGAAVGVINGSLVGLVGLPPFIITLGTMGLARSLAFGLTNGAPVRDLPPAFRTLGQAELHLGIVQVPLPLLIMVALAIFISLLLNRTVLGRYIYTLGRDEDVLRQAGVSTRRLKVLVYTLSGVLAACAGIMMTAWLGVAAPTAAEGYELNIIAAAVIGGTSLFGGEGSLIGVMLGAMLMQVLRNGLVLVGVPAYWQSGALGALILAVVLIDLWRRRRLTR
jgi:ribose transport system permease protein